MRLIWILSHPSPFSLQIVAPAIMLTLASFMAFFVSFEVGERLGFGITLILAVQVITLRMSSSYLSLLLQMCMPFEVMQAYHTHRLITECCQSPWFLLRYTLFRHKTRLAASSRFALTTNNKSVRVGARLSQFICVLDRGRIR